MELIVLGCALIARGNRASHGRIGNLNMRPGEASLCPEWQTQFGNRSEEQLFGGELAGANRLSRESAVLPLLPISHRKSAALESRFAFFKECLDCFLMVFRKTCE